MPLLNLEESSVFSYVTNEIISCCIEMYNTTRVVTTAEKRLFMTSILGIMGSFDEHNRLNLGHCSKA